MARAYIPSYWNTKSTIWVFNQSFDIAKFIRPISLTPFFLTFTKFRAVQRKKKKRGSPIETRMI
jgi:hypothetical protein